MNKLLVLVLIVGCGAAQRREERRQRMCADPNYAYEIGYNDGRERWRMDTEWADTCTPDVRAQVRESYQRGYQTGNRPALVRGFQINVGGSYTSARACRFSSDCAEGQSCRADASGTNVCMGGGYAGDACWFSSDCVSDSCDGSTRTCR